MEEKNINFLDYIDELEDPRIECGKLHEMSDILFLTLAGVICNCEGWQDIEDFGNIQLVILRKYVPFHNGVPIDDTLRRFFRAFDPEAFSKVFVKWVGDLVASIRNNENSHALKTIAIDGKTTRRSFDKDETNDKKALHLVNAFATDLRLVLCQRKVNEKSNEITAIPELLDVIDVCDAIVTIDAMGCQKKIAQKIIDKKGDYLLSVKGNQGDLLEEIKTFFEIEIQIHVQKQKKDMVELKLGRVQQQMR